MALISKSDLQYDYSWSAIPGDDPKITGHPDSALLNRSEGYEMLYFINKLAEIHGYEKIASGQKIEKMVKEDVPTSIRGQENIRQWIEDHW